MQQHILRISNYDRNGVKLNRIKNNEHHFNVNLLTYSALDMRQEKVFSQKNHKIQFVSCCAFPFSLENFSQVSISHRQVAQI